jgi:REP element-mobilizing transposase RayT
VQRHGYLIHACAIMPDHVHLVLGRHDHDVEKQVRLLKAAATVMLKRDGRHPMTRFGGGAARLPSLWGRGLWKVYLNDRAAAERAVAYVQENPVRDGKCPPRWSFVRPFAG